MLENFFDGGAQVLLNSIAVVGLALIYAMDKIY